MRQVFGSFFKELENLRRRSGTLWITVGYHSNCETVQVFGSFLKNLKNLRRRSGTLWITVG